MNERIKELVKQAGGDFWQRLENDVVVKDAYITFDPPENLAKFVELIVRECASQVIEHQPRYLTRGQAQEMANTIKEHFGIEE